jgi:hypothetical protein
VLENLAAGYRPALVIRTIAALTLAAGLAPRLSLLIVLTGAAMELLYLRSANAVGYTLLTGTCLLLAGDLGLRRGRGARERILGTSQRSGPSRVRADRRFAEWSATVAHPLHRTEAHAHA